MTPQPHKTPRGQALFPMVLNPCQVPCLGHLHSPGVAPMDKVHP